MAAIGKPESEQNQQTETVGLGTPVGGPDTYVQPKPGIDETIPGGAYIHGKKDDGSPRYVDAYGVEIDKPDGFA